MCSEEIEIQYIRRLEERCRLPGNGGGRVMYSSLPLLQ